MKKHIIIVLVLLVSFGALAQKDKDNHRDKLKALKVAHITEQLDLTTKEAQNFWPVYNAHETEKDKLRENSVRKKLESLVTELSEEDAKRLLKQMQEAEEAKVKSQKQYLDQLSQAISYKKIILLLKAERSFKQKMLEEFRQRRKDQNKN